MKTIGSFKLHKKGQAGISITTEQLSKHLGTVESKEIYHDKVETFREHITPPNILEGIEKLKYYFLEITGYWIDVYNQYRDPETNLLLPITEDAKGGRRHLQALWESVTVTQVKIDNKSFTIIGMIEVIDGKPLNLSPAKVTPDDEEIDFYEQARDDIKAIVMLLVEYFSTAAISDVEDVRRYLSENADEVGKQEIAKWDIEQVMNRVMDEMSEKGAIIMMDGDSGQTMLEETVEAVAEEVVEEVIEPEPEPAVEEPVEEPAIEPEPEPQAEMEEGDNWEAEPAKAADPYGQPAASLPGEEKVEQIPQAEGPSEIDKLPDDDFI